MAHESESSPFEFILFIVLLIVWLSQVVSQPSEYLLLFIEVPIMVYLVFCAVKALFTRRRTVEETLEV
jgi:hypothetical protein